MLRSIKVKIWVLCVMMVCVWQAGCSSADHFTVEGKLVDESSHIIELTYIENGSVRRVTAHSDEKGEWKIEGSSMNPTLAFLSVSGKNPSAMLVVQNGDNVKVELADGGVSNEIKVKGNRTSELLADFDRDVAQSIAEGKGSNVNVMVEDFIKKHPNEMASTVLLITRFDSRGNEFLADSLLSEISLEARPLSVMQNFMSGISSQVSADAHSDVTSMALYDRRDTTIRYNPHRQSYTLMAFLDTDRKSRDSVVPRLRELSEQLPEKRFSAIEVSLASDSASWKKSVEGDSATWIQAWAPGTVASSPFRKLSIRRVPFFILSDSTGRQIYRGSSISEAERELKAKLEEVKSKRK